MIASIKEHLEQIYYFLAKYFSIIFFLGGFLFDIYSLGRRVQVSDLYMVGLYIFAASLALIYLTYQRKKQISEDEYGQRSSIDTTNDSSFFHKIKFWLQNDSIYFALQFIWGSLASSLLILYFKSSGHYLAIFFCLLLAFLLLSNEKMLPIYRQSMTISWGLYSFTLMLWLNFILPHWLNSLQTFYFYLSTFLAMIISLLFYYLSQRYIALRNNLICGKNYLIYASCILLIVLNFSDVIPPVPLIRKNYLIGSDFNKADYSLIVQQTPWWNFWQKHEDNLQVPENNRLYFAASVFAPSNLSTTIKHLWQQTDNQGNWRNVQQVIFNMNGGREDGFRGYSFKSNIPAGKWRVLIISENNRTLEVINFTIANSPIDSELLKREKL